jgi:ribosome-binding protein aMBF1 (putative translation factor)
MNSLDKCEIKDCAGEAKHITSTESKIIQVCKDCYNKIYKR